MSSRFRRLKPEGVSLPFLFLSFLEPFVCVRPSVFVVVFGAFRFVGDFFCMYVCLFIYLFIHLFTFILWRMGKSKGQAHHTSTYFHTHRVSISVNLYLQSER